MRKIPTLQAQNANEWLSNAAVVAYRMFDGTPAAIIRHQLYKMVKVPKGIKVKEKSKSGITHAPVIIDSKNRFKNDEKNPDTASTK